VYYRSQEESLSPEEHVKTFASSRGEITLQPTYSGHYVYTFLQISDANYQRVDLSGPSIDQVVHPLASAHFADNAYNYGRTKKKINSCSGNTLDVGVLLRVRQEFL
jgi:nucleoporin POM152